MCLVDQVPRRSPLTLAISCTKFKIHSPQRVPWPKHFFFFTFIVFQGGPVSASQTKQPRKRMWLVDHLLCGSDLTPAISCTRFKIQSAHADSPVAKTGFLRFRFRKGQLCFTDQETKEENALSGPTPLWVSSYTSYLLYKVQDPFSTCGKSHGENIFIF